MKNEKWEEWMYHVPGLVSNRLPRYMISDLGRIKSLQGKVPAIINGSVIQGYRSLNVRLPFNKHYNKYIHKIVAELYVPRPSADHTFVIHLDYDKMNNQATNLKWATREMVADHNKSNPNVINMITPGNSKYSKLTEANVKAIKMMLRGNGSVVAVIARQFGITPTQVNRIKSGQNWGHVIID